MTKLVRFPDVSGILEAIEADAGGLQRFLKGPALSSLPAEISDYERKYAANHMRKPIAVRRLLFEQQILKLVEKRAFSIDEHSVFAGIDEVFELEGKPSDNEIVTHRLRFGSNRPCQWTTKTRRRSGDNAERTRCSVPVAYKDFPKVRASLIRTCRTAHRFRHMLIGQSGEVWFVKDKKGQIVEIVLYQAGRAEPDATSEIKLLAEIDPRGCTNAEEAVDILKEYEKLLGLSNRRIKLSNSELFKKK